MDTNSRCPLSLVPNLPEYHEFIRQLRNDKRVASGFIKTHYITKEEHKQFMENNAMAFYVCLSDNQPVGYVGVINGDIRICTHPDHQKKGVGKFMLTEYFKLWPRCQVEAKIKITNEASLKLFQACGFKIRYYLLKREDSNVT